MFGDEEEEEREKREVTKSVGEKETRAVGRFARLDRAFS
jgi:hypothetical protein